MHQGAFLGGHTGRVRRLAALPCAVDGGPPGHPAACAAVLLHAASAGRTAHRAAEQGGMAPAVMDAVCVYPKASILIQV